MTISTLSTHLASTASVRSSALFHDSQKTFKNNRNSRYGGSLAFFYSALFVSPRQRCFDVVFFPWLFITLLAILLAILVATNIITESKDRLPNTSFYTYGLTTTLALFLVFRLNRAAVRWWDARTFWGRMTADYRSLASAIIIYNEDPTHADEFLRWMLAFLVSTRCIMRGQKLTPSIVAGILTLDEVTRTNANAHIGLVCTHHARHHLKRSLPPSSPIVLLLNETVNSIALSSGGLERIRGTPLPLAFVAHLRTFLLFYLVYFTVGVSITNEWGPVGTVLICTITSYCFLVIDGVASDSEAPFAADRPHHLNTDGMVVAVIDQVTQILNTAVGTTTG